MATKRGATKKPAKKKAAAKKTAAKKAAPKKAAAKKAAPKKAAHPAVVHWEVHARDPVAQQRFFGELFGWKIDANNPMNYGMVAGAGSGSIGGGIGGAEGGAARVTVYVQVIDINATLARAQTLGARTLMPRTDIGMIIMAQFEDLEGNLIGLVEG